MITIIDFYGSVVTIAPEDLSRRGSSFEEFLVPEKINNTFFNILYSFISVAVIKINWCN